MTVQSIKSDCGATVSAEGKAMLDIVTCNLCGRSIRVTPRRLAEGLKYSSSASRPDEAREDEDFDVFISHASEDKDDLARPLAEALKRRGLRVWFDESELAIGDSIRRNIDRALGRSRLGVVLLSHYFFSKKWTNHELDDLFARDDGRVVVLPVLHKITHDELRVYSPTLAGRVSVSSDMGVELLADRICEAIGRENSRPILAVVDAVGPIDSIRRAILLGPNREELKRYLYEINSYLKHHCDNVDAQMLKDVIEEALSYERKVLSRGEKIRILSILFLLLNLLLFFGIHRFYKPAQIPISVAASPEGDQLTVALTPSTELQFALTWEHGTDLDLSVIAPSGDRISYSTPETETGRLKEDVRVGPGEEAIRIHKRAPGIYRVIVNDYSAVGTPEFELTVVVDGKVWKRYVGTLKEGRRTYTLDVDLKTIAE